MLVNQDILGLDRPLASPWDFVLGVKRIATSFH
jgi:hypothetical protein